MKRGRGNKKGKAKKSKLVSTNEVTSNVVGLNTEENPDEYDNDDVDSGLDDETTPSPSGTDQQDKLAKAGPVGRPNHDTFGKAVYTRVKVKIKTSKTLDSQHTTSDPPIQSDTDMTSQLRGSEKQGVLNEKMEDSANSLPETNVGVSMNPSRKSVGIKIKSSKALGSSSMSPCSNVELVKGDKTESKDSELLHQDSKYNEQELKSALEVIRKVMKMEAAVPFNVPVNPVALGIPDYFEVIDTPMDFGTICSNLEKRDKYMNAEDVFKDVQYIWENCYKYNSKGYFVELMKRVKKNFTKCWAAAGLFGDQPQETSGVEGNQPMDATPSSHDNTLEDGGSLNLSGKKFHGLKKHKEGCLCAICVMMRRRQEREEVARMMGGQTEGSDDSLGDEIKAEGVSHGGSPFGEYTSSNMENSPDADTGRKGQGIKLGDIKNLYGQQRENSTIAGEGSRDENRRHYLMPHLGSGGNVPSDTWKEMPMQHDDEGAAIDQQKPKQVVDKNQRAKMLENLRYLENPMLLGLYGTLFSDSNGSFWSGPHSLVERRSSTRKSSIHDAIATFMK